MLMSDIDVAKLGNECRTASAPRSRTEAFRLLGRFAHMKSSSVGGAADAADPAAGLRYAYGSSASFGAALDDDADPSAAGAPAPEQAFVYASLARASSASAGSNSSSAWDTHENRRDSQETEVSGVILRVRPTAREGCVCS